MIATTLFTMSVVVTSIVRVSAEEAIEIFPALSVEVAVIE